MIRTRLLRSFCLILLAGCLLPDASGAAARQQPPLTGTVTWVYDADTLDIAPHGKVRLLGIDAPEKSASDRDQTFTRLGILPKRLRAIHGAGLAYASATSRGKP